MVTGNEFGKYQDIKELRKKALSYYAEHLQGTTVENPVLGRIDIDKDGLVAFSGAGKRKIKSTSAKENKLLLVKYLPELIAHTINIDNKGTTKERHKGEHFYYLHTEAYIDGKAEKVEITLIKRNDGVIQFYNHTLPEEERKKDASVSPGPVSSNEALGSPAFNASSTINVAQGPEEVNGVDNAKLAPYRDAVARIMSQAGRNKSYLSKAENALINIIKDANEASQGHFDKMNVVTGVQDQLTHEEMLAAQKIADDALGKIHEAQAKERKQRSERIQKAKAKRENNEKFKQAALNAEYEAPEAEQFVNAIHKVMDLYQNKEIDRDRAWELLHSIDGDIQSKHLEGNKALQDYFTDSLKLLGQGSAEEKQNPQDARFGSVEDARKAALEAAGITSEEGTTKQSKDLTDEEIKAMGIDPNAKADVTFKLLDDSDEALQQAVEAFRKELNNLSANPMFNPALLYQGLKIGAIYMQRGANTFVKWASGMTKTLPESRPFLKSIWNALMKMPKNDTLNEKELTAYMRYVGAQYDHGMTNKVDLRRDFIDTLGPAKVKYFEAAYQAVIHYPSQEAINKAKGANTNVHGNADTVAARTGQGTHQDGVGRNDESKGTTGRSGQGNGTTRAESEEPVLGHTSVSGNSATAGGTTGNSRVQTQESNDRSGGAGSPQLPGSVRDSYERVPVDGQRRPDELSRAATARPNHAANSIEEAQKKENNKRLDDIKKALPQLLPEQQEDVYIAEKRLLDNDKSGMMFTNGTGTGKTYTGMGIVKRFVNEGKKNILIVAPNDGILNGWERAAKKDFGITLTRLSSMQDAGTGPVTTTYSNLGGNHALASRTWDAIILDESHYLMSSESARNTKALDTLRAISRNEMGYSRLFADTHQKEYQELEAIRNEYEKAKKNEASNEKELEQKVAEAEGKYQKLKDETIENYRGEPKSKVVFLSATPFSYVSNLDYANGYLFDYEDYAPKQRGGYHDPSARSNFFIQNFGYTFRQGRLEKPSADVDSSLMEREFNKKMVASGAIHGRMLSSAYDYDRGFILVDGGVGKKIDEGLDWLWKHREYGDLRNFILDSFDHLSQSYMLEAIKAKAAVSLIKQYVQSGKKVVVFHDYNKGGAKNPFKFTESQFQNVFDPLSHNLGERLREQYEKFKKARPDLVNLNMDDLESPIHRFTKEFGDSLALYNGTIKKADRDKNVQDFNDDNGTKKVFLVQSKAGEAGISLHDTTGKYQRVEINLGMPTRPITAIQEEGRIYRVGNKSNAIFRYLNTGTLVEQIAFATKIAERATTAENLALGEKARALKNSYIQAFTESQEGDGWRKYLPGSPTEGTGGKAMDYANDTTSDWDKAKTYYFAQGKKSSRNKSAEGVDYYATPEPLGFKMVEWAGLQAGEKALEPSAGHGAIARWLPDTTRNTVVEPSSQLSPKLKMAVANADVKNDVFENLDLHNKYNGIVMNPPFGKGGKTAIEHLAKAFKHLADGGRIVAIIPEGPATQRRFDQWFYGDPNAKRKEDRGEETAVLRGTIHLPGVTFSRAGTKIGTKVVIIDKYENPAARDMAKADSFPSKEIPGNDVKEFFDNLEYVTVPDRIEPKGKFHAQAAWHGSPAEIVGNLSLSYLGTGEGQQIHGYGLYFAQSREISETRYRDRLLNRRNQGDNEDVGKGSLLQVEIPENDALLDEQLPLKNQPNNVQKAVGKVLIEVNAFFESLRTEEVLNDYIDNIIDSIPEIKEKSMAKEFAKEAFIQNYRSLTEDNYFRDFTKTADIAQRAIKRNKEELKVWENLGGSIEALAEGMAKAKENYKNQGNLNGLDVRRMLRAYAMLKEGTTTPGIQEKFVAEKLKDAGLKGYTYVGGIDGRCFVIFDDQAISIMQRYEATVRAAQGDAQRSIDELKAEITDAFPNAKVEVNGNHLTFTMPNGMKTYVDLLREIAISEAEADRARQDHHIPEGQSILVEGVARTYNKDAYIALSQGSREGTGFHEAFHVAHDMVLTDKEKALLESHIGDEEAQADHYAVWVEARKKGRGTAWGKLWQKIQDFARKMQAILTRTENVHNILRRIESGDVWNRTEKDVAKANKKYAVTNAKITGATQVPVIDVTNEPKIRIKSSKEAADIARNLIGETFNIIGSEGTGKVASVTEGKHLLHSSNQRQLKLATRQKTLSVIKKILNNAVYVEKHMDDRHGKNRQYIELFAVVKDGDKLVRFRIVAREEQGNPNQYTISEARFYDLLQQKGDISPVMPNRTRIRDKMSPSVISVADLLQGVKDRQGNPYVNNRGKLLYDVGLLKNWPKEKKFSVRPTESSKDELKPIVHPQDIIDAINDIVPIYEKSKISPNATGDKLYNEHSGAGFSGDYFKLSQYGRILAMHLDKVLSLKNNKELTQEVLDRYNKSKDFDNLFSKKDEKGLTPAEARREGVSEFGSTLLENPELGMEQYPNYGKSFYEALKQHPDLQEKFTAVQDLIQTYQNQSVEKRASANISRSGGKKMTWKEDGVRKWLGYKLKHFYTMMVDDTNPLGQIVKQAEAVTGDKIAYEYDVQKQALMAKSNSVSRAILLLTGGKDKKTALKILNDIYHGAVTKPDTMQDVINAMKKASKAELDVAGFKTAEDALGAYLVAARTEELAKAFTNKYERPEGFDHDACVKILENAPAAIKEAAQHYWNVNTNLVNIMQQQGLISKKVGDKLRTYKHYCPMYRDMTDGLDVDSRISGFSGGRSFINISSPVKRIKGGSKRAVLDPLNTMIQQVAMTIDRAERNNVAKSLIRLDKDFPDMGGLVVRDPTMKSANPAKYAFTVWVNGEKIVYRTTPEVYDALTNQDTPSMNFALQGARTIAQCLRRGATISPSFIVRNFIRDTMAASINSQTGFIPLVSSVRGAWKLATDKKFATMYYGSGASMSTYIRADVESADNIMKDMLGDKYKDSTAGIKQIRQLIDMAWNKYDSFANLIEDSTRAAEFAGAMKKGLTIEQAGYLAKEVTLNFGRAGSDARKINRYIPFFNATIQGTDKFIRCLKESPMRTMFFTSLYIVLPSLLLWAFNHDDDWYKELDEETKLSNWAISLGGEHLLIPKPQEVGILFGGGVEAALNQLYGEDPKAMSSWAYQVVQAMTPSLFPAVFKPMVEWMANYSFWTGRPLVSQRLQKLPSEQQANQSTTELSRFLADTWPAKKLKLSPIALDNFISGYFGSAGRFIASSLDTPLEAAQGKSRPEKPAKYWYEMPFIGSFMRQDGANSEYVNRLYDLQQSISDAENRGTKNPKGKKEVDAVMKTVTKLNKEIRKIQDSPKMSAEQKRQEIDKRRDKIRGYAKKAVTNFGKYYE